MEEPILPTTYLLGDCRVEVMPYFLYEVCIYKITKNRAVLLESKFYKSDKYLNCKSEIKRYSNFSIVKSADLLAVTEEFVKENKLPIYK